jgi:hypothetical protein
MYAYDMVIVSASIKEMQESFSNVVQLAEEKV